MVAIKRLFIGKKYFQKYQTLVYWYFFCIFARLLCKNLFSVWLTVDFCRHNRGIIFLYFFYVFLQ